MIRKVEPVVLDGALGRRWFERPNALWKGRAGVRERRLYVTLSRVILPLLQDLETLQRKHYPDAELLLKGKTVEQVEADPIALEKALHLYELALSKKLILSRSDNKGGLASIHRNLGAPTGSCDMTPDEVSSRYVCLLAEDILQSAGHRADDLKTYIPVNAQARVASLTRLRTLVRMDKTVVAEMRTGLGSLDALVKKDGVWLDALAKVSVPNFLRPMRQALADNFEVLLTWSTALLTAAVEGLNHPGKIAALGQSILSIKNPAIFTALGAWPTAKGKQGEMLSRIAIIKKQLGQVSFNQLMDGSPALVKELGTWPPQKIELYRNFLSFLTGPVLKVIEPLDEDHRIAFLDALEARFGPKILTAAFKTKEGLGAIQGVVNELATMNQTAKQETSKVRNLVAGSYFDAYLNNLHVKEA